MEHTILDGDVRVNETLCLSMLIKEFIDDGNFSNSFSLSNVSIIIQNTSLSDGIEMRIS